MVEIPEPNALQVRNLHNSSTFSRTFPGNETVDVWTNLVTNPRGRNTSGTVTIRENFVRNPLAQEGGAPLFYWSTPATEVGESSWMEVSGGGPREGVDTFWRRTVSKKAEGGSSGATATGASSRPELSGSEGESVTVSMYARYLGPTDAHTMYLRAQTYSSGAAIDTHNQPVTMPAGEWTRIHSTVTATAAFSSVGWWLYGTGSAANSGHLPDGSSLDLTMFQVEPGRLPTGFISGGTDSPDPDFTPEWTGTPGESTSRLVAPVPVGWTPYIGDAVYYSESRDAVAVLPDPNNNSAYVSAELDEAPPNGYTRVFTLWTDTGNPVVTPDGSDTVYVGDGETFAVTLPTSISSFLAYFLVEEAHPVNTIYIRAQMTPGKYVGPYFDGHTELDDIDLECVFVGDVDDSVSAVRGDRVPHLNVINGAAIRSKGFTKFSPYSLRLINTGISDEETSAQLTGYIIYTEAAYKVWRHQKETLTVTGDGFGKVILPHFTGNQESNQAPNSPGTTLLEIYRSSSNLGFPRLMGSQGVGESVYFALSTAMQRLSIYHTIDPGVEEEIYRQTPPFSGPIEGRKPQAVTVLGQKVYTEWDGTPDESNSVFTIYEPLDAWGNRPSWGAVGDRIFEIGVDRGMIYPLDGPGVVWNGLISVVENSRNKEITPRYVLGTRYNLEILPGDFDARITAFTYPDEFEEFVGGSFVNDTSGLLITQQYAKPFNFTYRTLIGNDTEGNQKGYKLHLVYNAMAVPSLKTVRTLGEEMEPVVFTWDISTIPKKVDGYRGTAHLVIDSTKYNPVIMESFERILYGEGETPGVMPEPDEVVDYFDLF